MTKRPGILYVRFSTEEQRLGLSEPRQIEFGEAAAAKLGIEIIERRFDRGVSAFRGANLMTGALGKIYRKAVDGGYVHGTCLIFEDFDRFSRKGTVAAVGPACILMDAGLTLVTSFDAKQYGSEDDIMAVLQPAIAFSRSHNESVIKVRRQRKEWDAKREKAREKGTIMTKSVPGWLDIVDGKFRLNRHAATIRQIFVWSAVENYGRHKITRLLNDEPKKYPTLKTYKVARETSWYPSTVKHLLECPAVHGEFQPHHYVDGVRKPRGLPMPDYYTDAVTGEPAVPHDLFYRAAGARKLRTGEGGRRGDHFVNILSGLAQCGGCQAPMTYENSRPNRGYLKCDAARRNSRCTNTHTYNTGRLEKVLLVDLAPQMLATVAEDTDATLPIRREIGRLSAEVAAKTAVIMRYRTAFETDEGANSAGNLRRVAELETEIDALQKSMTEAQTRLEIEMAKQPSAAHIESIARLREAALAGDYAARSAINASFKGIIDKIYFQRDRRSIHIIYGGHTSYIIIDADKWTVKAVRANHKWLRSIVLQENEKRGEPTRTFAEAERRLGKPAA